MFDIFVFAFQAVAPVIGLILIGYILKKRGFLNEAFLKVGNKLGFRLALPALLFINIYDSEGLDSIRWDMAGYIVCVILLLYVLGILTARVAEPEAGRRGAVTQCCFRSNFVLIGIPVATALGGAEAEALASVMAAFSVPLFNVLSVICLSVADGGNASANRWKGVLKKIATNPLIHGALLGMLALLLRKLLPAGADGNSVFSLKGQLAFLYRILTYLAGMATPLMLIVLGGEFEFNRIRGLLRPIAVGVCFRLVAAPVIGIGLAWLCSRLGVLPVGSVEYCILIPMFGAPVAVSSALMAQEMGSDGQLAGQLVVWTNVFSVFSIYLLIVLMRSLGLL